MCLFGESRRRALSWTDVAMSGRKRKFAASKQDHVCLPNLSLASKMCSFWAQLHALLNSTQEPKGEVAGELLRFWSCLFVEQTCSKTYVQQLQIYPPAWRLVRFKNHSFSWVCRVQNTKQTSKTCFSWKTDTRGVLPNLWGRSWTKYRSWWMTTVIRGYNCKYRPIKVRS